MHIAASQNAPGIGTSSTTVADGNATPPLIISHLGDKDGLPQGDLGPGHEDQKYRNPASQMKWLVTAIEHVLDVTTATKPADIQAAAKEYYNEQISYQQAFRCLRLLTADIKEQGHRERVPDELRKAIVALRVFVDPPMDWTEIERKTGIKARTAGYVLTSAEKKSGGSTDPFVLLKNATISVSGPKAGSRIQKIDTDQHLSISHGPPVEFLASKDNLGRMYPIGQIAESLQLRKKRKRDDGMIDPNLDAAIELNRAVNEIEDTLGEAIEATDIQQDENDGMAVHGTGSRIAVVEHMKLSKQYEKEALPPDRISIEEKTLSAFVQSQ